MPLSAPKTLRVLWILSLTTPPPTHSWPLVMLRKPAINMQTEYVVSNPRSEKLTLTFWFQEMWIQLFVLAPPGMAKLTSDLLVGNRQWRSQHRGRRGRVPSLTVKKLPKIGEKRGIVRKRRKNWEEKAKIWEVLSLCHCWQVGLAILLGAGLSEQWRSHWGVKGGRVPPLRAKTIAKKSGKRAEKIRKKREKIGKKRKNRDGSFTLPLLIDTAGYTTLSKA